MFCGSSAMKTSKESFRGGYLFIQDVRWGVCYDVGVEWSRSGRLKPRVNQEVTLCQEGTSKNATQKKRKKNENKQKKSQKKHKICQNRKRTQKIHECAPPPACNTTRHAVPSMHRIGGSGVPFRLCGTLLLPPPPSVDSLPAAPPA